MAALGESLRLLSSRGFRPAAARLPCRAFVGSLPCIKGEVPVKLTIEDWDFLEYPRISLTGRPSFLPELLPHVDVLGCLCYFAPGAVTLDRYDPATALAQCLDQATTILNNIASDPNYRINDIQSEFPAHWEYGQLSSPWTVFLGDVNSETTSAGYFILQRGEQKNALITSDPDEAVRLSEALGARLKTSRYQCWLLQSDVLPHVPTEMPRTVKELFTWLNDWDRYLSSSVQKILGEKSYLKQSYIAFAVRTPVGWIGFGFDLDQVKRIGYAKNPKHYRNYLHNAGGDQLLFRIAIREVSGSFVHSRNLSYRDLYNKRVTVVGCGAIGSFVAAALVRLGAGTGKLGRLKLIDPENLGPENLGRHVLGYPALMQSKSEALKNELLRQFPHSFIEAHTHSVIDHAHVFAAELIIDATGEETVSEYLNGIRLQRKAKTPILHVWIRGNGEAVQALWADAEGGACYRCLLVPDAKTHRKERFPLLKTEPLRRTDGCRAYTPYAVSAPMHAAALATDMVCAWLQGNPSPRFRTRSQENADVLRVKNQNPPRMMGCAACGQH
ncbi:ThiF family adenylyltransferase [Hylemonella sp. W303a]|uniref:ThiF family adenylyltransferase n=1 Tax=Hylemonella sp. W303a TaxID=3389873 RepID=UPI00396B1046